jgi:prevent-host-death family protein
MSQITISEFKASCLRLIEQVRRTGEPILVTKNGKPAAMVVPPVLTIPTRIKAGLLSGRAKILGDIVSPVSEDDWSVLK